MTIQRIGQSRAFEKIEAGSFAISLFPIEPEPEPKLELLLSLAEDLEGALTGR